jgi:hypothetical protein
MTIVSRVYDSYAEASNAVTAVEASGIPASDVSLVANKYVSEKYADVHEVSAPGTGAGIGGVVGGGAGLLAGLGLLAIPGLGPVVAAGWLAATAVGAVAGAATGGIVGALVGAGVSEKDAHVYSESVRRGGTLVSVRTKDADAARVQAILDRYKPNRPGGARHRVSPGRMDDLRSQPAGLSAQRRGHRPYTSPRVI